ncbi:acetoacetate--CoA ligase [Spirosoma radiotolerans]|uniref:Acetoacetyl-CoA synthetase n=1 Tax=Spirosoma radiotolerans TaxID=1379870 RepID=A0A0E3V9A5_9BACT|nr:acetoacetate--CoA ligase [Spirosoma radiotolerans]AKD57487.1 acetoacetyl-CoA synthetase [Spirosoma radiotolerans]
MSRPTLTPLYTPTRNAIGQSLLKRYMDWLFVKKGLYFRDYDDLWDWSVTDLEDFWESIWQFFDVQSHTPYHQVIFRPNREDMIGVSWFSEATLNYAEHIFRHRSPQRPAILFSSERQPAVTSLSWETLERQVAAMAAFLRQQRVGVGDRVVAVLPNGPEAIIAFLATNAIGAVWSSCSPDFGTSGVIDRFQQIEPKLLIAADGYSYNGKAIDKTESIRELRAQLPTLQHVIWVPYLDQESELRGTTNWHDALETPAPDGLTFEPVPFDHPIWILYSSGTTGKPKAITHSVGGCLLEHMKALGLHQDVRMGERYFWYSTTGWMMWNYAVGSMLVGATLVLYDGAPGYPNQNILWKLADTARINHFGGGAAYYLACLRAGLRPIDTVNLSHLRTIGSTGSPLPPEGFRWIYESVKPTVWLISLSGGTDVCSGFVGGNPLLPVYEGEIQSRLLGCKVEAFDENAQPVRGALGEMVILEPMPSMPIYFWNDRHNEQYRKSYFDVYPGIWRHGDYIRITERNGVIIYGRSDATLNRDGIRIGTSEIYSAVESLPEVADSLIVGLEQPGGKYFMPLFVVLRDGFSLTDDLIAHIKQSLRNQFSPRHVPDAIYAITDVPYTISGKKLETPVKKILSGMDTSLATSKDTVRNPASLEQFMRFTK